MNGKSNTRTLIVRTEVNFIQERGQGLRTRGKGEKVKVSFSAGIGYGTAFMWDSGGHWTSCIDAAKGPETFTNWPKHWKAL